MYERLHTRIDLQLTLRGPFPAPAKFSRVRDPRPAEGVYQTGNRKNEDRKPAYSTMK